MRTDALSLTPMVLARLAAIGFKRVKLTTIPADEALTARIDVAPGPMAENEVDVAALLLAVDSVVQERGIDRGRYPVQRNAADLSSPLVTLPLAACSSGARPSYAGIHPDRYEIRIESDDRARSQAFVDALQAKGYRALRRAIRSEPSGFSISHPHSSDAIAFIEPLRRSIELAIREVAGESEAEYGIDLSPADTELVTAVLPLAAVASGALMAAKCAPARCACTIYSTDPDGRAATGLKRRLSGFGWGSLAIKRTDKIQDPRITYGGAALALLQRVQGAVAEMFPDLTLRLSKAWSASDMDVWIHLPAGLMADDVITPATEAGASSSAAAREITTSSARPFVAVSDDHVAIGRYTLPRRGRHELAPDPALFARYVVDQPTAENLDHIAASVLAAEPCLIEGATATSKTSAIMFLASLLGQGVIRLNLNGQTDSSELIGRYVPSGDGWRWSPGAAPRAMREGLWLVLDELNLGEPSVVERLNSALESSPSLYLGEFDCSVIGGSGGDPTHPAFRVMASVNPTEGYVGRSPLSPALRDRFVGYRRARRAGADDIRGQLRFVLFGEEPSVVIDGVRYAGRASAGRAFYGDLANALPDLEPLIDALARFHVGAEAACEAHDGAGERPVITRRSLLGCLGFLDAHRAAAPREWPSRLWYGIERYYLGRISDPTLRVSLVDLAAATGIRADRWSFS